MPVKENDRAVIVEKLNCGTLQLVASQRNIHRAELAIATMDPARAFQIHDIEDIECFECTTCPECVDKGVRHDWAYKRETITRVIQR